MRIHLLPKGQSIAPMPPKRVKDAMFDHRDIRGPFSLLIAPSPPQVLVGGGFMRGMATNKLWG